MCYNILDIIIIGRSISTVGVISIKLDITIYDFSC